MPSLVERAWQEKRLPPKAKLGGRITASLQPHLESFLNQGVGGRIFLPDKSAVLVFQNPALFQEWRLVFWDEEHGDVALLSFPYYPSHLSLIEVVNPEKFLDILNSLKKSGKESLISVYNRLATASEIQSLQISCQRILGDRTQAELFCLGGGFRFRQSNEPIYHDLTLIRKAWDSYLVILQENITLPKKESESHSYLYRLNRDCPLVELSLPELYLEAIGEARQLYPDFLVSLAPGLDFSHAREAYVSQRMKFPYFYPFNHFHFVFLSKLIEESFEVESAPSSNHQR